MASGITTSLAVPPSFALQPRDQFAAAGDNVTLTAAASGSQPLSYQWQFNEANLTSEVNPTLVLSNVTAANAGNYRVIAMNGFGSATSAVARVMVGARVGEVFGTGVNDDHLLLPGGAVDPHYQLAFSDDPDFPGPAAIVLNEAPPIPPYFPNGPVSKWIGPRLNLPGLPGNAVGTYVYRAEVVLDTVDPASALLNGRWGSDNDGLDIRLNGASLGIHRLVTRAFDTFAPFSITNGLVAGLNIIELVVSNQPPAGPTALRVDLSGVGMPLPPGLPRITSQPQNRTFVETDAAILSLIALGAPPLSYQWYRDGNALAGERHRTLRRPGATLADSGDYQVVVSNGSGSVTSRVARLTVKVNESPVAGTDGVVTALGTPVTFPLSRLLANDADPDGQTLLLTSISQGDAGGSVTVDNGLVTYTPSASFFPMDTDKFYYTINDGFGGAATGTVEVLVLEAPVPEENHASITPTAGGYRIRFFGASSRPYQVQRAPTVTGPWNSLMIVTTSVYGLIEYQDTAPLPAMAFYRIAAP